MAYDRRPPSPRAARAAALALYHGALAAPNTPWAIAAAPWRVVIAARPRRAAWRNAPLDMISCAEDATRTWAARRARAANSSSAVRRRDNGDRRARARVVGADDRAAGS